MLKKISAYLVLLIFMFSLSGCATARKQSDLQMQGLRNQISALEIELQTKDEEIISLREALAKAGEEKGISARGIVKTKVVPEIKSRPNVKQAQLALKNAGFNPGRIDGKMGRQTREAIRAFQRENNLAVDGRVGKRTWALLREYLYKKIK